MISATSTIDGPPFTVNASVRGLAVYLDNFALIGLAKGDPSRRRRFIETLRSKGDLLFSVSNAVDLSGPQGKSLEAVRLFLDELGPHWVPVELDPFEVANREIKGAKPTESCISVHFVKDYVTARFRDRSGVGEIVSLSSDFFNLGAVLDWIAPQRESIRKGLGNLDDALIRKIAEHRMNFDRDPHWLDKTFPELPFNPLMPATFAYVNLVRTLVLEAKARRLKTGDGLDLCHAVMASAFGTIAALDKNWKRRVESLPRPNRLAPVYYEPELDKMVSDMEALKRDEPN